MSDVYIYIHEFPSYAQWSLKYLFIPSKKSFTKAYCAKQLSVFENNNRWRSCRIMPLMEEVGESRNNDLHSLKLNHDKSGGMLHISTTNSILTCQNSWQQQQHGWFDLHVSKEISLVVNLHIGMMMLSCSQRTDSIQ